MHKFNGQAMWSKPTITNLHLWSDFVSWLLLGLYWQAPTRWFLARWSRTIRLSVGWSSWIATTHVSSSQGCSCARSGEFECSWSVRECCPFRTWFAKNLPCRSWSSLWGHSWISRLSSDGVRDLRAYGSIPRIMNYIYSYQKAFYNINPYYIYFMRGKTLKMFKECWSEF